MIISFDFDDTLVVHVPTAYGGRGAFPSTMMIDLVQEYHALGCHCIILTAREDIDKDIDEIKSFLRINYIDHCIKEIVCTNGSLKGPFAKDLGVKLHFDDDHEQIQSIRDHGIKVTEIKHF